MRSRKRSTYTVILGLAILALLADRFLLGYGQARRAEAGGATVPTKPHVRPEPGSGDSQGPEPRGPGPTSRAADRLRALARRERIDMNDVSDAFAVGRSWLAEKPPAAPAVPAEESAASAFRNAHQFIGILTDELGSSAIVGDVCLRVGDVLDGFVLVSVGDRVVVFARGKTRVELGLSKGN